MNLYHVTSAVVAQQLLKNPVFSCASAQNELSGLHAYGFRRGYFLDQQPHHQGVKLVLRWTGEVEYRSIHDPRDFEDNILYVQYPWRVYLKSNAGQQNLQIRGILDDHSGELPNQLGLNLTEGYLTPSDYQHYVNAKTRQYLKGYWRKCAQQPVFLTVGENKEIRLPMPEAAFERPIHKQDLPRVITSAVA